MGQMGDRIRALRLALPGGRSAKAQREIAERAGFPGRAGQVRLSRIEKTQEPSVDEAIRIIEAMGPYAADFLVVPVERRELLKLLAAARVEDAGLALRLLAILPELHKSERDLVEHMIEGAELVAATQDRQRR